MPPPPVTPAEKLSFKSKAAYTSGVFLDQAGLHAVNHLAMPVYNVLLGMNPALIGYALAAFRIWDAVIDPIMGFVSDRFDSRWGRRKPFMFAGALLCGMIFPLVWWASPAWGTGATMTYFVALNVLYFTALTIYAIPYQALGYELTSDVDQRTSLYTLRGWVSIVGFMGIGWIFPLSQLDWFSSPVQGVHFVTAAVAVFFVTTALVPVAFLRERFGRASLAASSGPKAVLKERGILNTIGETLRNPAYLRVVLLSCLMVVGPNIVASLSFYINVYYVYGGDVKAGSIMNGTVATVYTLANLAAIPLLPSLGHRFGKSATVLGCLIVMLVGSALKWVCFTPEHPWWQLLPMILVALGNAGFWTLAPSMVADVCDLDEYQSGQRREGMYASVTQWVNKVGYSAANALSGLVLVWVGFNVALGGDQSPSTLIGIRVLFAAVPAVTFVVGLLIFWRYPLSRDRLAEIQAQLVMRRGPVEPAAD